MGPLAKARLCVVLAALLWSTSGAITKVLYEDTALGLNEPPMDPLAIAFWRVAFAAVVFLPAVRRRDLTFRPSLWLTGLAFALMNALFVTATAWGSSANAIFLQYTAPLWVYALSVGVLGEPAERRGTATLLLGMAGIVVLCVSEGTGSRLPAVTLALCSGLAYALVMIGLRVQRDVSPRWPTAFNFLFGTVALLPFVWRHSLPSGPQLAVLFVFGGVRLLLSYWLLAVGLRRLRAAEVGTLSLIDPLLNPLWAYLILPEKETPSIYTLAGGACILGALVWRYWPSHRSV